MTIKQITYAANNLTINNHYDHSIWKECVCCFPNIQLTFVKLDFIRLTFVFILHFIRFSVHPIIYLYCTFFSSTILLKGQKSPLNHCLCPPTRDYAFHVCFIQFWWQQARLFFPFFNIFRKKYFGSFQERYEFLIFFCSKPHI